MITRKLEIGPMIAPKESDRALFPCFYTPTYQIRRNHKQPDAVPSNRSDASFLTIEECMWLDGRRNPQHLTTGSHDSCGAPIRPMGPTRELLPSSVMLQDSILLQKRS